MTQPDDSKNPDQAAPDANQPRPAAPSKEKKRRLWLKIAGALLIVLILLVVLLPTIASLGFVRSIVLEQVNKNLNGKVEVSDWSLGWMSGAKIDGFKVLDESGKEILGVPKLTTQLTLLDAARGKYNLGKTTIEGPITFAIVVDKEGRSNLEKLPKEKTAKPPSATEASDLPDVNCDFSAQATGTISQEGKPVVYVDSANIAAKIPGINQPISNDVSIQMRVGERGKPGTIKLAGSVAAIKENKVLADLGKIVADQKLEIQSIDLGAANAMIPADLKAIVAGLVSGAIEIKSDGKSGGTVGGNIAIENVQVTGDALKGDTFRAQQINIPIQLAADVSDASNTRLDINTLRVEVPDLSMLVDVKGSVSQQALNNLAARKAPGGSGTLSAVISANDFRKLATELPHLLALQQGVTVEAGKLTQSTDVTINPQNVQTIAKLQLADVRGTSAGKAISIEPVLLVASATVNPGSDLLKGIADLSVDLQSAFAQLKGGGPSLAKINLDGSFDLSKLRQQLSQFADLGATTLDGAGTLSIESKGDVAANGTISTIASIAIASLSVGLPEKPPLSLSNVNIRSAAELALDAESSLKQINSANLNVSTGEPNAPLFELVATANNIDPQTSSVQKFEVSKLAINDLSKAQSQLIDPVIATLKQQGFKIERGGLYANVSGSYDGATKTVKLDHPLDVSTPGLTVSKDGRALLNDEKLNISVSGALGLGGAASEPLNASVKGSLATVEAKNARLATGATGLWNQLTAVDLQLEAPDLGKLYALSSAFSAPTTQPATEIAGGSAKIVAKVSRNGNVTRLAVSECQIDKLALKRADKTYAFDPNKPITLKLVAEVAASEAIESLRVTELAGDFVVAQVSMPQPILVNDPSGTMTANGEIAASGKLGDVTPLLAFLGGSEELPYAGDFSVQQKLSTDANKTVALVGNITAKQFQVFEKNANGQRKSQPAFTEPELVVGNNLSVDATNSNAVINALTVDMPQTKAFALKLTGGVRSYDKTRDLDKIALDLTYDLAKLWPIVHPMMITPGEEDTYKNLKIAGAYTKKFTINGSYPADVNGKPAQWYESVRTVKADGDLTVDMLDTGTGIDIQKLDVPIWLTDGLLVLKYANKSKADQVAKPAQINGGTLDLAGIAVYVGEEVMRISVGKNQKIIQKMTINPLLGQTLGKYINPVFTNTERAKGLLDVTVEECDKVAIGEAMKTPQSGKARIVISLTDMDIANPLGSLMLGPILQLVKVQASDVDTFKGQIRNAVVTLDAGVTTQQITMELEKGGSPTAKPTIMPLSFAGDINLASLQQSLAVTIPTGLLASGGDLPKIFPNGIQIMLGGTTLKPQVDIGAFAQSLLEGQGKNVIEKGIQDLLRPKKDDDNDKEKTKKPAAKPPAPADKAKKPAAKKPAAAPPPASQPKNKNSSK